MCSATRSQAAPCGPGVLLVPLHFPGSLFLPRSVAERWSDQNGEYRSMEYRCVYCGKPCPETMQPMPASGIMLLVWHKLQKTRLVT
ncbi:hypothetical protein V6N11_019457 [Hibiscus sabdariffa]|uniref:Uncharacterized protein n=1 Tax=Hibiscus sabdariffa TaxID=183260 RepID=A0ABR1ZWB2_9ROSI